MKPKLPLGADRKKLAVLGGLAVILVGVIYWNSVSSDSPAAVTAPSRTAAAPVNSFPAMPVIETRPRPPLRPGSPQQLRLDYQDHKPDPTTVDPSLRLDLLAKVQAVQLTGGERNLFQFVAPPLPKQPEPKIIPGMSGGKRGGPAGGATKPPEPPPPPPPPPIPLKFYGYSVPQPGVKRAFFLDGDDIIVAAEGDMIEQRYKVVRIGVNSCVVEDTRFQHEETLPLEEQHG